MKLKVIDMFEWYAKLKCLLGLHQYIPIRYIWVQHRQPVYVDDPNYTKQGEIIVSILRCTCCNKRKEIKILK